MSSLPRYVPNYTFEDYQHWEGDWELWHGAAVAMTPSPFGRHGAMLARLVAALINSMDAVDCDASVLAEVDWKIGDDTVVRPDVSVVCGNPPEGHVEAVPALIVEVLSDATRDRDQTHKRQLYQNERVPWYLIADPEENSIQLYRLGNEGEYEPESVGDHVMITICDSSELKVDLSWRS